MLQWKDSQIEGNDREQLEQTIVEYNDILAGHRLDIGINTQGLPVSINMKEDLTVELALMHRYGILTTLPFSTYASPIFANQTTNCVYLSVC